MSLPLVTRFGADPLLDLEVANKRYVDNSSSAVRDFYLIGGIQASAMGGTDNFLGVCGARPSNTEAFDSCACPFDMTWSEMKYTCQTNSATSDQVVVNRIAGSDGSMTVTLPSSTTGVFSDDINTDTVDEDDIYNWQFTRAGGGTTHMNGISARQVER